MDFWVLLEGFGLRVASVVLALLAVVFGLLWLIHGLSAFEDGAFAGGWWKGPLIALAGLWYLGWCWSRRWR